MIFLDWLYKHRKIFCKIFILGNGVVLIGAIVIGIWNWIFVLNIYGFIGCVYFLFFDKE